MRRLVGIAAAEGIAIGSAFVVKCGRHAVRAQQIPLEAVEDECARFVASRDLANARLSQLKRRIGTIHGDTTILDAHQLMVNDRYLLEQVHQTIRDDHVDAEWALLCAAKKLSAAFDQVDDRYLRERRNDIDALVDELLFGLIEDTGDAGEVPDGAVIVAHNLSPADVAHYHRFSVSGIVMEAGGPTCHAAIMARSLSIPAIVGVDDALTTVDHHHEIIVDGNQGVAFVKPDPDTLAKYRTDQTEQTQRFKQMRQDSKLPRCTKDGVVIEMMANIDIPEEIPAALEQHIDGIGLYRTEYLILESKRVPSEDDYYEHACHILALCTDRPVTFRTIDINHTSVPTFSDDNKETNPAMGLRAIRLCLKHQELFKPQIRGLLRAARSGDLRIMFPMISSVEELREAKTIVEQCRRDIYPNNDGPKVPVGMMVELPAAALAADLLAKEADFFAIGTNDLVQYVLGIDRSSEQVSHLYHPLHPAVLRIISQITQSAKRYDIPVSVCGEMAATPALAMVLIGLGIRKMSLNVASLAVVSRMIRHIKCSDAEALAEGVAHLDTAQEIEATVRSTIESLFPGETVERMY